MRKIKGMLCLTLASALLLTACEPIHFRSQESQESQESQLSQESQESQVESVEESKSSNFVEEEKMSDLPQRKRIHLDEPFSLPDGTFEMTIHSFSLTQDDAGRPILVMNYDWENKGDEETTPDAAARVTVFQNKVETDRAEYGKKMDMNKRRRGWKKVKPGGKVTDIEDFLGIDDMDQPLELEIVDSSASYDDIFYYKIDDLKALEKYVLPAADSAE